MIQSYRLVSLPLDLSYRMGFPVLWESMPSAVDMMEHFIRLRRQFLACFDRRHVKEWPEWPAPHLAHDHLHCVLGRFETLEQLEASQQQIINDIAAFCRTQAIKLTNPRVRQRFLLRCSHCREISRWQARQRREISAEVVHLRQTVYKWMLMYPVS